MSRRDPPPPPQPPRAPQPPPTQSRPQSRTEAALELLALEVAYRHVGTTAALVRVRAAAAAFLEAP